MTASFLMEDFLDDSDSEDDSSAAAALGEEASYWD